MRAFASSYCNLFCYVWSLALAGTLFSEGKQGGVDLVERVGEWVLGAVQGGDSAVGMKCIREE